jgi:hypothetical protein
MAYYEVRKRMNDFVNSILLQRGEVIETDDDLWVKRLGTNLKKISNVSTKTKIIPISGTKEGQTPVVQESASKPVADKEVPKRRGIVNSVEDKMVSADDSDVK